MIEPVVALFAFTLFGALYAIVILLTRKKLDRDSQRISFEQDEVVKKLQEGFGGIRDILVSNTQSILAILLNIFLCSARRMVKC